MTATQSDTTDPSYIHHITVDDVTAWPDHCSVTSAGGSRRGCTS